MNDNIWAKQQLTKEQAIELAKSKEWEKWTAEQVVKFQLFQKRLCMDFAHFHKSIEHVLGRPVFTHEFGLNYEGIVMEYLVEKPTPTFDDIINLIPEEKRIIIGI